MMNKALEQLKSKYIADNLYLKEEITKEEYDELPGSQRHSETDLGIIKYYKITPVEASDEDLQQFISLKTVNILEKIQSDVKVIKGILNFWCILTIINIVVFIIVLSFLK